MLLEAESLRDARDGKGMVKIGGGRGVNPGFGKIETKDSKYGRDELFGGLTFIILVQKMK